MFKETNIDPYDFIFDNFAVKLCGKRRSKTFFGELKFILSLNRQSYTQEYPFISLFPVLIKFNDAKYCDLTNEDLSVFMMDFDDFIELFFLCTDQEIRFIKKYFENLIPPEFKDTETYEKLCTVTRMPISPNLRARVFARDGIKCLCCGGDDDLAVDHIIPITLSGSNEIENLQTLCKTCNLTKGTKVIDYREGF